MKVLTTHTYPGREVTPVGLVYASTTRSSNFIKDFWARIIDLLGGQTESYKAVLEGSVSDLYQGISNQAKSVGADAVIGLQIVPVAISGSKNVAFQATGTAVKFTK